MDSTDFPISRSPRKELQGPRPPALKVRKDSHKIKKPPVAPQSQHQPFQSNHPDQQPIYQQPRQPVIIYTVSPKVIHTNPSDFMTLVQRLTGPSPISSSAAASSDPFNYDVSSISPAARYATIEKAARSSPKEKSSVLEISGEVGSLGGFEMMGQSMPKSSLLTQGILSPGPASLPPIPPSFFSPPSDPNSISFYHDLSPVLHGNRNFMEGSFMPSPSTFMSPRFLSPSTPSIDLFNNFNNIFDL